MEIPASYFPGRAVNAPSPAARLETLENIVRDHLCKVLAATRGKIEGPGGAAEILALNPSTLRGKLRKYGIPFGHKM
jgi:transcriptional regulator with GAF, ATPase, and Fis domain